MTEKELKELIQLIKDNELYCRVDLETNETELSEDGLSYSEIRVRVYRDEQYIHGVFQLQLISGSGGDTYFLEDESCQHGEDVMRQTKRAVKYCKYLMAKYM